MSHQKAKMPPSAENHKKLKIVSDFFDMAVKIKSHQLKQKFPNASEQEIKVKVVELIE